MRAADGERDLVRADVGNRKRRRRTRPVRRAEPARLDGSGERGAEPVTTGGRQEGDASWTAVGASPRPNRDAAHVEQIDEVGVGAEPRIRADRIGSDFRHRHEGRDGRHAERVDRCKLLLAGAAPAPSAGRLPGTRRRRSVSGRVREWRAWSDAASRAPRSAAGRRRPRARRSRRLRRACARRRRTARNPSRPASRRSPAASPASRGSAAAWTSSPKVCSVAASGTPMRKAGGSEARRGGGSLREYASAGS